MDTGGITESLARKRTPDLAIAKVRQGQKMLNEGHPMIGVIQELQITEVTWYRWFNQYGSEKNAEASKCTKEAPKNWIKKRPSEEPPS